MLQPMREDASLGCPPAAFTTNTFESLNAVLKRKVSYKKNELPEFVKHLKNHIDEQERELERAVIGRGKYRLQKEFKHLQCEEEVWFRMSREQRANHLKKVANTSVSAHDDPATTTHQPADLSVDPTKFHNGLNAPLPSVQGIWSKAATLVSQLNSVVPAPGDGTVSRMVASKSGKQPHLFTFMGLTGGICVTVIIQTESH